MNTPQWLQPLEQPFANGAGAFAFPSTPSLLAMEESPLEIFVHGTTRASFLPSASTNLLTPLPTPSISSAGSPAKEANPSKFISTTFHPTATLCSSPHDIVLVSSDAVFFYVHSAVLLRGSSNRFDSLVPNTGSASGRSNPEPIVHVAETSAVLNIVLHTLYGMSCQHYAPSNEALVAAVDALARYGADLQAQLAPDTPLFAHILARAPTAPVELFATAAHHDVWALAVAVSPYMLGCALGALADAHVQRIGAAYLRRLFVLHLARTDALKRILLAVPRGHLETRACGFAQQKELTRAWALASACLAWDARPDLSTTAMEAALRPLGGQLTCAICKSSLHDRIKELLVQWALVRRTI